MYFRLFVLPPLFFLARLYLPIGAAVLLGISISVVLARPRWQRIGQISLHRLAPAYLGQFLFWIGVPLSIVGFLYRADLSGGVFLAPVVAWGAMLLGLFCSRLWLLPRQHNWPPPSQGSFSLAAMLGNTGYIGYPVALLLPQLGPEYFGWTLFYDALGTLLGAYGLGVVLAAHYSGRHQGQLRTAPGWRSSLFEVVRNPSIIAFFVGLALRLVPLPGVIDQGLYGFAWFVVMLSLVLMGMRLHQISSWQAVTPATIAVGIKMLLVPLTVGTVLTALGLTGPPRLALVLQAGMPCAFATLVLAEAYDLDKDLAVTCVGLSSLALIFTLPIWLWGFSTW